MDLNEIRMQIDQLDQSILHLFEQRMELCQQVAAYKKAHHMEIFQEGREAVVMERIGKAAQPQFMHAAQTLFSTMLDLSKQLQTQMLTQEEPIPQFSIPQFSAAQKIGCQGMEGANSEQAAKQLFPEREITFFPTFESVFEAVEEGKIEYGVLPIYNSTAGSVTATYDLLHKHSVYLAAMTTVAVNHCLVTRPGLSLDEIHTVYSHPQGLSQCSDFLSHHNLIGQEYSNTATAAKLVADSDAPIAAICSENCAKLNHLQILAQNISNVSPNYTRFICITKELQVDPNASIISIMLTIPNEPGSLSKLLEKFYIYNLNLDRIESRPIQDGSFGVVFHIDFKGNLNDRKVAAFLNSLCKFCMNFKLLGNVVVQ